MESALWIVGAVAVWYFVAYHGLREMQLHGEFLIIERHQPGKMLSLWLLSVFPPLGMFVLIGATIRGGRLVATLIGRIGRWLFPME